MSIFAGDAASGGNHPGGHGMQRLDEIQRLVLLAALHEGLGIARELRSAGIGTDLDGRGGSMKSMLRRADSLGARVCLVIGDA